MNKKKIKNAVNFIFAHSGGSAIASRLIGSGNPVRILLYHRVNDLPLQEASISDRLTISVENFRKQMKYISDYFEVISLANFIELVKTNAPLPDKAVIVTFDDGYRDNYKFAFPILKEFKIPATIYLATDFINSNRFLWWDVLEEVVLNPEIELKKMTTLLLQEKGTNFAGEDRVRFFWEIYSYLKSIEPAQRDEILKIMYADLKISPDKMDMSTRQMFSWEHIFEMSKSNISFGAHTQSHVILSKISLTKAKIEIQNSKNEIEYRTQNSVTSFAYPNGGLDTFNEDIVELLKNSGFESAVTTVKGFAGSNDNLFQLKRYNIDGEDSLSTFKCKLSGIYELPAYMKNR